MAFGKEIKRIKENEKISAEKLAAIIGVDADRLRKWMEKDFNPRDEDLRIIEANFRMPLENIMKLERLPKFLIVPSETEKITYAEEPPGEYFTIHNYIKLQAENNLLNNRIIDLEKKLEERIEEIGKLKEQLSKKVTTPEVMKKVK